MTTLKGKFTPKNPGKYIGNSANIVYRSSWELKFMKWCDLSNSVVLWQSEEVVIPYLSPLDGKIHRYFPDFRIKIKKKDGSTEVVVIEIKPLYQTKEPKPQKRKTKKYINEVKTYSINKYKWDYAKEWCENRGYKFMIFTEKELGINL